MNANQIVNMVVRIVVRRLLRSGVNAGISAVGKRMNRPDAGRDDNDRTIPGSAETGNRVKKTARMMRRLR